MAHWHGRWIGLLLWMAWPGMSHALDANLLPEGVARFRVYATRVQANRMWDADGHEQPLGRAGLDRLAARGLPDSRPGVYAMHNEADLRVWRTDLEVDYGLKSWLNIGIWLPILQADLENHAELHRGSGWGALPASQRNALSSAVAQLDTADAERDGLGDLFLGGKARVFGAREQPFRLALGGGLRLPTGHVADPLDPRDLSTGGGHWDLALWSWWDWQPSARFLVNLHTRHELGLSAHRAALLPADPTHAATMAFVPGLHHDVQLEPQWRLFMERADLLASLFLIYNREEKEQRQEYDPARGGFAGSPRTQPGTDWQRLILKPTLGLNLQPMGMPMVFSLGYGTTLWGDNTQRFNLLELRMEFLFRLAGGGG